MHFVCAPLYCHHLLCQASVALFFCSLNKGRGVHRERGGAWLFDCWFLVFFWRAERGTGTSGTFCMDTHSQAKQWKYCGHFIQHALGNPASHPLTNLQVAWKYQWQLGSSTGKRAVNRLMPHIISMMDAGSVLQVCPLVGGLALRLYALCSGYSTMGFLSLMRGRIWVQICINTLHRCFFP